LGGNSSLGGGMTSGSSFGSMSPQQNTGIEQGKRFALFATD
jgi:hypothetical protein